LERLDVGGGRQPDTRRYGFESPVRRGVRQCDQLLRGRQLVERNCDELVDPAMERHGLGDRGEPESRRRDRYDVAFRLMRLDDFMLRGR
jgi:hypothetical protein